MIVSSQILSAVQARLTGDATITATVPAASIGSFIKEDTDYPIIYYKIDASTMGVKDEDGQEVALQFDVWTNARGAKTSLDVADRIRELFDLVPITIASGDAFGSFYESMDSYMENEGTVYRATILFRLLVADS